MSSNFDMHKLTVFGENRNIHFRPTGDKQLDDGLTLLNGLQEAQNQSSIIVLHFVYAVNKEDHLWHFVTQLENQCLQLVNLRFSATVWSNENRFEASL